VRLVGLPPTRGRNRRKAPVFVAPLEAPDPVVPAWCALRTGAGTHTPRPVNRATWQTTSADKAPRWLYGSLRSRGRRGRREQRRAKLRQKGATMEDLKVTPRLRLQAATRPCSGISTESACPVISRGAGRPDSDVDVSCVGWADKERRRRSALPYLPRLFQHKDHRLWRRLLSRKANSGSGRPDREIIPSWKSKSLRPGATRLTTRACKKSLTIRQR